MLGSTTCEDLEQLLACENCLQLKPELFASYIKIMNYMHEIELDCAEALPPYFPPGQKIPAWAEHASTRNTLEWNKVVVLDQPEIKLVKRRVEAMMAKSALLEHSHQDNTVGTNRTTTQIDDASMLIVKSSLGDSMISRYSQKASLENRKKEAVISYQLAMAQQQYQL